jgi:hypothetical protein
MHVVKYVIVNSLLTQEFLETYRDEIINMKHKLRINGLQMYTEDFQNNLYQPMAQNLARGVRAAFMPISSDNNGDCFYSSLSTAVTGNPNFVACMRLSTLSCVITYHEQFDTGLMR